MNAAVSSSTNGIPLPVTSSPQFLVPIPGMKPVDQFKRTSPIQTSPNKNSPLKTNGKLWMEALPLTGIATIFTDWRTVFNKVKTPNLIKLFKKTGTAIQKMGMSTLNIVGDSFANVLETGAYTPALMQFLLEAGFHMLKVLADIPFALFG